MNPGSDGGITRPLAASALPLEWLSRPGTGSPRDGDRTLLDDGVSRAAAEAAAGAPAPAAAAAAGGSLKDSE